MLEVDLLAKNIDKATDEGIGHVKAALERYVDSYRQNYRKQQTVAAMEFHFSLADLSNSPISIKFLRSLFDMIYFKHQVDVFFVRHSGQGVGRHKEIVEQILAGDKDGACQALLEDIRNVRNKVVNGIKRSMEEKENLRFISNEGPKLYDLQRILRRERCLDGVERF
jgi:DNA-binding GntR family transcriptional regulator